MSTRKTLEKRIAYRIARMRQNVFMRNDFGDLSGYDQVGRGLQSLVRKGQLVRMGYGIYAKTKPSSITGKPMLAAKGGFTAVSREALDRLSTNNKQFKGWEPSIAESDYNAGRSTQIPANAPVKIKGRMARSLSYNGLSLARAT